MTDTRLELNYFTSEKLTKIYPSWPHIPYLMRFSNKRIHKHYMDRCHTYQASFASVDNHFIAPFRKCSFNGTMADYSSALHGKANTSTLV